MGNSISLVFRAALAEAIAALPQPSHAGGSLSAADMRVLIAPERMEQARGIATDLLAVVAEIQRYRDTDHVADHFLRQHGIVTRIRSVR